MKLEPIKDEIQAIADLAEEHPLCDLEFLERAEREGIPVVLLDLAAMGGDAAVITEITLRAREALRLLEKKEKS